MNKTLYLMIGIPGSGKSTYVNNLVKDHGAQVVCPDDIRKAFGHIFWGPMEPMVHAQAYFQARCLMSRGLPVVVDECHTRPEYIRRWRQAALEFGYEIVGVHICTNIETCKDRRDDGKFPLEVIDRKAEQLRKSLSDIILELDLYIPVMGEEQDAQVDFRAEVTD